MNKRKLIISIIVVLVIVVIVVLWQKNIINNPDNKLFNQIKNDPSLVEIFDKAKDVEKRLSDNSVQPQDYLTLGFYWKSLGDRANIKDFYYKSLAVYEAGAEKYGTQNTLFYWNAGKLAEDINDYERAESYYKKSIEIAPGDESGYIGLASLYFYKMKKTEAEVLKVYEEGIKKMVINTPLIAARASYLRLVGDNVKALDDYKILLEIYPDNAGYKEIIKELQQNL